MLRWMCRACVSCRTARVHSRVRRLSASRFSPARMSPPPQHASGPSTPSASRMGNTARGGRALIRQMAAPFFAANCTASRLADGSLCAESSSVPSISMPASTLPHLARHSSSVHTNVFLSLAFLYAALSTGVVAALSFTAMRPSQGYSSAQRVQVWPWIMRSSTRMKEIDITFSSLYCFSVKYRRPRHRRGQIA